MRGTSDSNTLQALNGCWLEGLLLMERTPVNPEKSPKKRRHCSKLSTLDSAELFEAATAGKSREISMLLSKFAEVLRERAAADSAQIKELEGILMEAENLECYLKEKKSHLRKALNVISDKLQG